VPTLDSPHWSYFHGCRKHPGQIAPCQRCVAARDPDITLDNRRAFSAPAADKPRAANVDSNIQAYLDYMAGL